MYVALFADDMIVYVEDPKNLQKNLLGLKVNLVRSQDSKSV